MASTAAAESEPRLDKRAETRRRLELAHKQPLEHILTDAITRHGSYAAAARALGVHPSTIHYWANAFGIRTKTVAYVAFPKSASR